MTASTLIGAKPLFKLIQPGEKRSDLLQESDPVFGQRDASGGAVQQLAPYRLFEQADVPSSSAAFYTGTE